MKLPARQHHEIFFFESRNQGLSNRPWTCLFRCSVRLFVEEGGLKRRRSSRPVSRLGH